MKISYCNQVTINYVKPLMKNDIFVAETYERELALVDQMNLPVKVEKNASDDSFDYVRAVNGVIVKELNPGLKDDRLKFSPRNCEIESGEVLGFAFADEGFSVDQLVSKFDPVNFSVSPYVPVNSTPLVSKNENVIVSDGVDLLEQQSFLDECVDLQDDFPPFDPDCLLSDYVSSGRSSAFEYKRVECVESINLVGEASRIVRCVKCSKEIPVSLWKYENVSKILCYGCLNARNYQRVPDRIVRCSDCSVKLLLSVNCVPKQFTKKYPRCSACVDSQLKDYCLPRLNFERVNLEFCFGDFSIDIDSRPDFADLTSQQIISFRQFRLLQFDSLLNVLGFQIPYLQKIDLVLSSTINEIVQFVWEHKQFWMENSGLVNWLKALGPGYSRWGDGPSNYSELIKRIEGCPNSILDYGCGSGHGISQIKKRFPFADCRGYDVEDLVDPDLEVVCDTVITKTFDVVVMNNVLHHVTSLDSIYDNFMSLIGPCTQIVVKDHCATNENLFLLVLVHICYLGGEIERMVFRSPSVLEDWFSNFGVVCSTSFVGNVYNDVVMNFSADS